jgi:hypothetical protein
VTGSEKAPSISCTLLLLTDAVHWAGAGYDRADDGMIPVFHVCFVSAITACGNRFGVEAAAECIGVVIRCPCVHLFLASDWTLMKTNPGQIMLIEPHANRRDTYTTPTQHLHVDIHSGCLLPKNFA